MTVALHNDIFPQGNTYLKNAAPIVKINNKLPLFHKFPFWYDPIQNPLLACIKININTTLQILACRYRTWCIATLFSINNSTTPNDMSTSITTYIDNISLVKICNTIYTAVLEPYPQKLLILRLLPKNIINFCTVLLKLFNFYPNHYSRMSISTQLLATHSNYTLEIINIIMYYIFPRYTICMKPQILHRYTM